MNPECGLRARAGKAKISTLGFPKVYLLPFFRPPDPWPTESSSDVETAVPYFSLSFSRSSKGHHVRHESDRRRDASGQVEISQVERDDLS